MASFALTVLPTGLSFGAVSGSLADYEIDDKLIKQFGNALGEASSAVFDLTNSSALETILLGIEPFEPRVLKASLWNEKEVKLKEAL